MERIILHSDINNFYASVESLYHPEYRSKPLAVLGDPEARHGIVLAKNELAKACGVKTGEPMWQAQRKCPGIVFVKPRFSLYEQYSRMARQIYEQYTDRVEPFGMDECWLDVTESRRLFGTGEEIAAVIRKQIKQELGITVSVGVSFNKVFAKLGSDMRKPDAMTVIPADSFREIVWPLPVENLLFVGGRTLERLHKYGIFTIGHLAQTDCRILERALGKMGVTLWQYANGLDKSPVALENAEREIKTVGNSTTLPRDLTNEEEVRFVLLMLSESVSARLRAHHLRCRTVQIGIRDSNLHWTEHQGKLTIPNRTAKSIYGMALALYRRYADGNPVRSLGVRACDLEETDFLQLSLLEDTVKSETAENLESAVDALRHRFGHSIVQRGRLMTDAALKSCDPYKSACTLPTAFTAKR